MKNKIECIGGNKMEYSGKEIVRKGIIVEDYPIDVNSGGEMESNGGIERIVNLDGYRYVIHCFDGLDSNRTYKVINKRKLVEEDLKTIICPHCDDEIDTLLKVSTTRHYDLLHQDGTIEVDVYGDTSAIEEDELCCPECNNPIKQTLTDKLIRTH